LTNPSSGQILSGVYDELSGRELRFNIAWSAKIDGTVHFWGSIQAPGGDIEVPTHKYPGPGGTKKFAEVVDRCVAEVLRKHRGDTT
jgi:hypothetical protein